MYIQLIRAMRIGKEYADGHAVQDGRYTLL